MPVKAPPHPGQHIAKAFGGLAEIWLRLQVAYDLALVRTREDEIRVEPYHPHAA